ncbi:MAG: multiprotein-bridging factor 1 family protein [Bacteroidales bacterium]
MKQPELGLKILDVRQTKGLTQEELVTLCNINVRTLQRIESGEVEPRGSTIRLISKALDFDFVCLSSNNDAEADAKEDNAIKSDYMRNLETAREIVIERYASLSHTSVEKIKSKLENEPIDSIVKNTSVRLRTVKLVIIH